MGKRHLTPAEINYQRLFQKAVDDEVRRRCEEKFFDDRVRKAIVAAHKADIVLALTVLIDAYEADKENTVQFLNLFRELLKQYNDGTVQLKQMQKHIEIKAGVDLDEFAEFDMELADIKTDEGEGNETKELCGA